MENDHVHPLFKAILGSIHRNFELTEADRQEVLRQVTDPNRPMHTGTRMQLLGQYGTAEDIARFVEALPN